MKKLSLREYCIPCGAKCCKTGDSIASPILSEDEAEEIKENLKEVTSPGGIYYLITEQQGTNRCAFLTDENKCRIQDKKPLDCLCYPIKAAYGYAGAIEFVIDTNCPAAEHLTPEFIQKAKRIALKSIARFDKKTYQHWIDNHEIWAKNGTILDAFLDGQRGK